MLPTRGSTLALISLVALAGAALAAAAEAPGAGVARGTGTGGEAFELALIGDTPYGVPAGGDHPEFERLVADVADASGVRWVLHAGDVKGEGTDCTTRVLRDRLERLNAFGRPVVVTPGDNDWTDCHRSGDEGRDPLDRLAAFREVFYADPGQTLGGERMAVQAQAEGPEEEGLPENVRWSHRGVVFATVHVVGSQNATNEFPTRDADDAAEVERRTAAAVAWLHEAFDRAEATDAPAVFVMMHANPGLGAGAGPDEIDEAYRPVLTALEARTRAFDGPVALAHGDTHYFRVDKPVLPRSDGPQNGGTEASWLPNFTRVESFGAPRVHWVRVRVDPDDPEVFSFEPEIVDGNRR